MTSHTPMSPDATTIYSAMCSVAKACEDHAREQTSQTDVPHALWNVEALHCAAAKRFAATVFEGRTARAKRAVHDVSCDLDEDCTCGAAA